ncbi:CDP-diacylglycerol--glycerol-3-phosphate 3-phosphatidyltransferase [Nitrospirota bacterium]
MKSSKNIPKLNLPTILTLSRIVVIPFFIYVTPLSNFLGALIFIAASITDFLDGYLARRNGQVTTFGAIIDPIADKFFVIAALIMLVDMDRVSVVAAVIIIVREFLITALRVVALKMDVVIKAEMGGKLKTTAQITAIICLILGWGTLGVPPLDWFIGFLREIGLDLFDIGTIALWISVVLGVGSGIQYIVVFWNRTLGTQE